MDRTNRVGAAGTVEKDEAATETVPYSESSGSEAANEQVLDSASSSHSSLLHTPPDDSDFQPIDDNTMHQETMDVAIREPRRQWHFTQYGFRQFAQHTHRTVTRYEMTTC
jgi:hypothetical protein